jgi:hypothetical protein
MKVSAGEKVFRYSWIREEPLNHARKAAFFLNSIMRKENDDGENGSGFSWFPSFVARVICISSSHRFILQILIVITIAWRKTN